MSDNPIVDGQYTAVTRGELLAMIGDSEQPIVLMRMLENPFKESNNEVAYTIRLIPAKGAKHRMEEMQVTAISQRISTMIDEGFI